MTLLRIYPAGTDARLQYDREVKNPVYRDDLLRHNSLTRAIGDTLFEWFRSGKTINGRRTPYLSFSTGFRGTEYNRDAKDTEAVIYAVKMFPMNVYITPEVMNHVLDCVIAARDDVAARS